MTHQGKTVDRRVVRTRHLLAQALLSLMEEKNFEAITVQDIIDRANVGRSTFYAHFKGKQELLISGFDDLRRLLGGVMIDGEKAQPLGFSRTMFEHARENKNLWRAVVGRRIGVVVEYHLRRLFAGLVREALAARLPAQESEALSLSANAITGAYVAILTQWLEGGARLSVHEVDGLFHRLIAPGIASVLSGNGE